MDHNMLRHKELFKEQSMALSPRNHNAMNRELQRETRAKQRNKRFESNRIISLSPTPRKPAACQALAEPTSVKENHEPNPVKPYKTPQVRKSSTAVVQKQLSRQEQYLQRFLQWKAECKKKYQKLKPRVGQQLQSLKDTAQAPLGKGSETFRPPANLQQKDASATPLVSRRSLYMVIEPNKHEPQTVSRGGGVGETAAAKHIKPAPMKTKPQTIKPHKPQTSTVKAQASTVKPQITTVKPQASTSKPHSSTARPLPKIPHKKPPPLPTTNPSLKSQPILSKPAPKLANVMTQPFSKPVSTKPITSRTGRTIGKAQILKPQPIRGSGVPAAGGGGGAAAKFKSKIETKPHVMRANLTTRMKPKGTLQGKHAKALLREILHPVVAEPPQTPLDTSDNPFHSLVTSTQCKSNNTSSVNLMDAFGEAIEQISPVVRVSNKCEGDLKVKRQLINKVQEFAVGDKDVGVEQLPGDEPLKRKFNFEMCESMIESPTVDCVTIVKAPTDEDTLKHEEEQQTPPRRSSSSNDNNYLSPYVTCSRGKVNSRNEKEKRNSMYLQDPETPLEVRLALKSVNYFRQQLAEEIERLHVLCQEWEEYCQHHESRLTETGGLDMINVTIGQTKLLTSKKMMQFKGLIDRCEAGAKGTNSGPNDGSEDSKPVLAKDLEGWWDMLKLQSDNVDKRFANLKKWRDNDWLDPDARKEVKPKITMAQPLKAAKPKAKGKASSSLKQFLQKAKLKHKQAEEAAAAAIAADPNTTLTSDIPGTPSSRRSRRLIVVRDRKSFSPARTVLRLSRNGNSPRSSIVGAGAAGNQLLKTAILGATLQHTTPPRPAPVAMKSRASILKTPGTAKRESVHRGVVFSAKKNVRRFQFTFDEDGDLDKTSGGDKLEDCVEDMSAEDVTIQMAKQNDQEPNHNASCSDPANTSRTYTLRNRRVKLRPSSEFM
ncbi:guanylate kinase-associated protein mars [Drosophila tropicalis]|uniref:guanylate kinase-associated protein mars n=1 Tax=Drosophila tropicalis TaxID=46794 RepID=UPI0035ABC650